MPKGQGPACSSRSTGLRQAGAQPAVGDSWWRLKVIGGFCLFVYCLFIYCLFLRWRSRGKSSGLECQDARLRNLVQINNSGNHYLHLLGI